MLHAPDELSYPRGELRVLRWQIHAYKMIAGCPPPDRELLEDLPFDLKMLYRALTVELVSPVRVALGYSGFRSESLCAMVS
jgi:hypothetical protein